MMILKLDDREMQGRIGSAIGAIAVQMLIGYALIIGLAVHLPGSVTETLKVFDVAPKPLPPPVDKIKPHPNKSRKPEGAASPPNLNAKATEIVSPPPIVLPVELPPLLATMTPGIGSASHAGNADIRGPGTGRGGQGNGAGSGRSGNGEGGGGDEIPPRFLKGRIKDSDYPAAAGEAGVGGTVSVRYVVATTGRATECAVTRSSGNVELDAFTCRLIEKRFRYKPSRDARGVAVRSMIVESHSWVVKDDDPPPPAPGDRDSR